MLAAAISKLTFAGRVASEPSSGIVRYSACAPNRPSLKPNTFSPTAKDVTPRPTASTTPANSHPRIVAFGLRNPLKKRLTNGFADRKAQSVRFTVVACTLTSTS